MGADTMTSGGGSAAGGGEDKKGKDTASAGGMAEAAANKASKAANTKKPVSFTFTITSPTLDYATFDKDNTCKNDVTKSITMSLIAVLKEEAIPDVKDTDIKVKFESATATSITVTLTVEVSPADAVKVAAKLSEMGAKLTVQVFKDLKDVACVNSWELPDGTDAKKVAEFATTSKKENSKEPGKTAGDTKSADDTKTTPGTTMEAGTGTKAMPGTTAAAKATADGAVQSTWWAAACLSVLAPALLV